MRGHGLHTAWFRRLPDGRGLPLDTGCDTGGTGERALPALALKTDWPDEAARELVADYLAWRSPRLLTLQTLDDPLRARLERQAGRRALDLDSVYRLIPHILDHARLEAARVEARLRRSAR